MEKETHCDVPNEPTNATATQPTLRTDVILHEENLSEEAKALFGFHSEILHAFQLHARITLANDRLTPIGRHLFCTSLEQHHTNCKDVLNYIANHPEVQTTTHLMPPLLVLCGAARTGSTLLFNLLACDPASRAPLFSNMVYPVPPLPRSDPAVHERGLIIAEMRSENLKGLELTDYERKRQASHASYTYEEDIYILYQAGFFVPMLEPHDSTELATWFYDDTNKDFVYEYHKAFMQMLNSVDAPQSHWLLKAPWHAFNLDTLLRHYPTVSLIMTHRRLQDVLPSSIRLGLAQTGIYFDSSKHDAAIDRQTIINRRLRVTDTQLDRIVKFRRAHPHASVFDVFYDDLMEKPVETVRDIYNHFGLEWSKEFEQAMLTWLRENPQGKQGRNTYTLQEFGLTDDAIEEKYEDYIKMFLNPRE